MLADFGMVVEDGEGTGERRWGGIVGRGRRLRGYRGFSDDFAPINFDPGATDPTVYPTTDGSAPATDGTTIPTGVTTGGPTDTSGGYQPFNPLDPSTYEPPQVLPDGSQNFINNNYQVNPIDPASSTGLTPSAYSAIVKAAQDSVKSATDIIKAATNSNGTVSCGSGYIYDPITRNCYRIPGGFDTNTLLMVGAGGLALFALFFFLKK